MPWEAQVCAVVQWTFVSYWRAPQDAISKFALHIFTALFEHLGRPDVVKDQDKPVNNS